MGRAVGGRRVFVGRRVAVKVTPGRPLSVALGKGSSPRGVNVLSTIGVTVPVRVASGGMLAVAVGRSEGMGLGVPVATVDVGNEMTCSSGSELKNSAFTTPTKTSRITSPINNASTNTRFCPRNLRRLRNTLLALLTGIISYSRPIRVFIPASAHGCKSFAQVCVR